MTGSMEERPEGRHSLPEDEWIDYLTVKAARKVEDRARRRREQNRWWVGGSALAILAVATGVVNMAIDRVVEAKVEAAQTALERDLVRDLTPQLLTQVNARISQVDSTARGLPDTVRTSIGRATVALRDSLRTSSDFALFAVLATSVDAGEDFSRSDRDALLELIDRLAGEEHVVRRREFSALLQQVVGAFSRADQRVAVDRIDDALRPRLIAVDGIVERLLKHYGQRVVGSPRPVAETAALRERYAAYARAAQNSNLDHLALLWDLLIRFRDAEYDDTPQIGRLVESVQTLDARDAERFRVELETYSHPFYWLRRPTPMAVEITRTIHELRGRYHQLVPTHPVLSTRVPDGSLQPFRSALEGRGSATAYAAVARAVGRSLTLNQTAHAELSTNDFVMHTGTAFQEWALDLRAGQTVAIELRSDDFDAYMYVAGPGIDARLTDDDGAGGCDARINLRARESGTYLVVATTTILGPDGGRYELTATDSPREPRSERCQPIGRTSRTTPSEARMVLMDAEQQGSLTTADSLLPNDTYAQLWALRGTAGQRVTLDLRSDDFDAFLMLAGPGLAEPLFDDDSGGGCHARIVVTLPETGPYTVIVNTARPHETGRFTLSARARPEPSQIGGC